MHMMLCLCSSGRCVLQCCRAGRPLATGRGLTAKVRLQCAGAGVWTRLYTPTLCSTADTERWRHPATAADNVTSNFTSNFGHIGLFLKILDHI